MRRVSGWIVAIVIALGGFLAWLAGVPPRRSAFYPFPADRECAIAITDDTDGFQFATVDPVYAVLDSLGLRVTKTVWAFDHVTRDPASVGLSLDDPAYRSWIARAASRGHEIALHSPSCGDDDRSRIIAAHERLRNALGIVPRIETFHSYNREALYWGRRRIPNPVVRSIYAMAQGSLTFEGHVPETEYYWLDLARDLVRYTRTYTTNDVNTLALNPSMPYEDDLTPLAPLWFASSNGRFGDRFVALLSQENVERLKDERGATIVYTHFASDFTREGAGDRVSLRPDCREVLVRCGTDPAIEFVPAGELLDRLRVIQLVEDAIAGDGRATGEVGGAARRSLRVELPRDLLPVLGGVSVDPRRVPERYRSADAPDSGRIALLPWMAQARIVTDIVPSTVFEGARRIGWRERWRLVIRWMMTQIGTDT